MHEQGGGRARLVALVAALRGAVHWILAVFGVLCSQALGKGAVGLGIDL